MSEAIGKGKTVTPIYPIVSKYVNVVDNNNIFISSDIPYLNLFIRGLIALENETMHSLIALEEYRNDIIISF